MNLKYKNLEIKLEEDLGELKEEIKELKKLHYLLENSAQFYLLEGKTQLIGKNKLDGIRSRREHTDGIKAISKRFIKTIYEIVADDEIKEEEIYRLNLEKELLYTQIIAEVHDLGHTPFGHLGERILNKCIQDSSMTKEELNKILEQRKEIYGEEYEINQGHHEDFDGNISFEHNEQSAKLLFNLIEESGIDTQKIDVQRMIQAVLSHSVSRVKEENIPDDLVAQIVRQADKIEYVNNDFEEVTELINSDFISDKQLIEFINTPKNDRIKDTIQQLVEETLENGYIDDHMDALQKGKELKNMYQRILFTMDTDGKRGLLTGENVERIVLMLTKVYNYYIQNPEKIPCKSMYQNTPISENNESKRLVVEEWNFGKDIPVEERAINYICRMDDQKVENVYKKLVKERIMNGKGNGVEPITAEEIEDIKKSYYLQNVKMQKIKEEMDGTEHSEKECEEKMKLTVKRLIQYGLTSKGRERMEEVRKLHEAENQKDQELLEMMKYCDANPSDINRINLEKARKAAEEVKRNWNGEAR